MKLDALDHPKTLDLASQLDVSLPTVIGHLELLWAFTGKKAPQGNIGKWPDGAIARACFWMGDPAIFIGALRSAGFLDEDTEHRLIIHDWQEHAPGWVRAKLKKTQVLFLNPVDKSTKTTREPSLERSLVASKHTSVASLVASKHTLEPTKEPSIQGKGREGKTSEGKNPPTPLSGDVESEHSTANGSTAIADHESPPELFEIEPDDDPDRDEKGRDSTAPSDAAKTKLAERRAAAERIFDHWRVTHDHPKAQLDEKRRKKIYAALDHYPESDLCDSITGYRNSPHHMGTDPKGSGAKFDDIELFLRDGTHIDRGLKFLSEPPRTDISGVSRRNIAAVADWVPPEIRHERKN